MNYRPDIDGLRAIAILLVLTYHGGLALFPSGFIGVDVFFVISGFLITGIIHESLNTGSFSFVDFYNRRLWRLQPVFISLIFITTLLTFLFFLPDDLIQFSRSARKTSLFISNLFFNQTTTGYFSPDTQLLPLLHTWSLSVEWQCYFILPLLMYLLHRVLSRRNVILAVLSLAFVCLLISLNSSKTVPAQTYYQFSSRIFEFLIGATIAIMPLRRVSLHGLFINGLGFLSLIIIFCIASFNHILIGYPNWYAFSVCVATATLIALGKFYPDQLCIKVLSIRLLVFIGVLSYSLYIWHWVVFSVLRYQSRVESASLIFLAYGVTFLLAYLSWKFIERPARKLKQIQFRYTFVCLLLLPILFTHLTSYFIKSNSGFPQRFSKELVTLYQKLDRYNSIRRTLCISNNNTDIEAQCKIGSDEAESKKGFLIGDSFANHYWGFMDTLGKSAGVSILVQGTSSCITLPGVYLYDWWYFKNQIYQECYDQTLKYYQMIQQNHYDYVMIGQIWDNYFSDSLINHPGDRRSRELAKQRLKIALDKALKIITKSGAKPVLIQSTALSQGNTYQCFFNHIKWHQPYNPKKCSFILHLSENEQWLYKLFEEMKIKYPQLIVIDPKKIQCRNKECFADINGVPVYRDAGHITDYASYEFGKLYLKEDSNPLI